MVVITAAGVAAGVALGVAIKAVTQDLAKAEGAGVVVEILNNTPWDLQLLDGFPFYPPANIGPQFYQGTFPSQSGADPPDHTIPAGGAEVFNSVAAGIDSCNGSVAYALHDHFGVVVAWYNVQGTTQAGTWITNPTEIKNSKSAMWSKNPRGKFCNSGGEFDTSWWTAGPSLTQNMLVTKDNKDYAVSSSVLTGNRSVKVTIYDHEDPSSTI